MPSAPINTLPIPALDITRHSLNTRDRRQDRYLSFPSYYFAIAMLLLGLLLAGYEYIAIPTLSLHLMKSSYLLMAFAGSFYLYIHFFFKTHRWPWLFGIIFISIAFIAPQVSGNVVTFYLKMVLMAWMLGLLHFINRLYRAIEHRIEIANGLGFYFFFPIGIFSSQYFLTLSSIHSPYVHDEWLLAIEGTLGCYPSMMINRFILWLPNELQQIMTMAYLSLPLILVMLCMNIKKRFHQLPTKLIFEFLLMSTLGYWLYDFYPACGSKYAFIDSWPTQLPNYFSQNHPHTILCSPQYPRNNLPSLHTAWMVFILRYSRLCSNLFKKVIPIYAFLTLLAVFTIGAHYLIDVVVGFAFATGIGGLCIYYAPTKDTRIIAPAILGSLLCISWYLIILYGLPYLALSTLIAWLLFIVSTVLCIYSERLLWKKICQ